MSHSDFTYSPASKFSPQLRAHVFHEKALIRAQIAEDLRSAGYQVGIEADVDALLDQGVEDLGDVIILDCEEIDAQQTAGLAKFDMLLARSSVQLVVTTSMDGLDAAFSCFDQTNPEILVDASRAERMLAVVRCVNSGKSSMLREMSEDERVRLMRLSEQVDALAKRLDEASDRQGAGPVYFAGGDSASTDQAHISAAAKKGSNAKQDGLANAATEDNPALPSPRFVRQIIRQRQARSRFFDETLFGDPAWDMLLDLTAAHGERHSVSVTSLCIASGVPATTALRWLKQMVEIGLFERTEDTCDKRRAFIGLSEKAVKAMARYFAEFRAEPAVA